MRLPPSAENPVVIDGILPNGPIMPDDDDTPAGFMSVLILGCEPHIARLMEVNLERQGYECESYPTISDIPTNRAAPWLLIFDGDSLSDLELAALVASRGWTGTGLRMVGERPGKHPRMRTTLRKVPSSAAVVFVASMAVFLVFLLIRLLR